MKKLRLRKWVKVVLVIIALVGVFTLFKKMDDDFMDGCMKAGYSEYQCKEAK